MGSPTPAAHGQDTSDTQGGIVHYRVGWTSGSSGAVPSFPLNMSEGITSVTHGSTGVYTVVLANNFYQFAGLGVHTIKQASYSKTGACDVVVTGATGSTGTVVLLVVDGDGDAVDPTTNDVIYLDIEVQNYKSQ